MTAKQVISLIDKAEVGMLDAVGQMQLAAQIRLVLDMNLKLERSLHDLIKQLELDKPVE